MAARRRNLFLYLALACFCGIIAIFIVDGYLGIYDTTYITAREYEYKIGPEYWLSPPPRYEIAYSVRAEWSAPVHFRYEIDNRRLSTYSSPIQASVWKENEKVIDLFSEEKSIEPFGKVMVEWTLDSKQLESGGLSAGEYTVKIKHGEVERRIVVNFRYPAEPVPPKAVPPPSPD